MPRHLRHKAIQHEPLFLGSALNALGLNAGLLSTCRAGAAQARRTLPRESTFS